MWRRKVFNTLQQWAVPTLFEPERLRDGWGAPGQCPVQGPEARIARHSENHRAGRAPPRWRGGSFRRPQYRSL